ncbi:MAG TPA: hypothetical protein VJJ82_04320 [Candidatus Nanoarchaeia archaeon]|nr:hypothetical protein [Candidatus Nanoarchaeia archaeon]
MNKSQYIARILEIRKQELDNALVEKELALSGGMVANFEQYTCRAIVKLLARTSDAVLIGKQLNLPSQTIEQIILFYEIQPEASPAPESRDFSSTQNRKERRLLAIRAAIDAGAQNLNLKLSRACASSTQSQ